MCDCFLLCSNMEKIIREMIGPLFRTHATSEMIVSRETAWLL